MISSIVATLALAVLAMAPGWVLVRGAATRPGMVAAAATASLAAVMLASALLATAWQGVTGDLLPAFVMGGVALLALIGAHLAVRDIPRKPGIVFEWEGVAIAAAFAAFGLLSLDLSVAETADGGLLIHSWYNADWFKHLGHVHAIANLGLPPRDFFGGASPLYYYWLSYVLAGAGTAIGGDAWVALSAANTVFTLLFTMLLYGLIRLVAPRTIALVVTLLALFITAPSGFFFTAIFGEGWQALLEMQDAPKGPALMAVAQFIPQHALAASLLMAWGLLAIDRPKRRFGRLDLLALGGLAGLVAISSLLGATLLVAYGLTELSRRRVAALPELAAMVIIVAVLALVLNVVQIGNPDSALESPLFTNPIDIRPWYMRMIGGMTDMISQCGLPLVLGFYLLVKWQPAQPDAGHARTLATAMIVAALGAVAVTQAIAPERIGVETIIRAVIPAGIAAAIIGAGAIAAGWSAGGKQRWVCAAVIAALTLVALPGAYIRTIWMNNFGDVHTTLVPRDDRLVLAKLREMSAPDEQVWQYPEPPKLARERGDDSWSVVFAGRAVPNSERATDFARAAGPIDQSRRFFEGADLPIPKRIAWVYVSRILAPGGYQISTDRMRQNKHWEVAACYADACLFRRVRSSTE